MGKYREMRPELVDVSDGIKMHTMYPRMATPPSKLNKYLQQRMLFEKFDQERRRRKEQAIINATTDPSPTPSETDKSKTDDVRLP